MSYTVESTILAMERVKQAALNGELQTAGICSYEDANGMPCAVGYLLTETQRRILQVSTCNDSPVNAELVSRHLGGEAALQKQLGMSVGYARRLQRAFDGSSRHLDPVSTFAREVDDLINAVKTHYGYGELK